MLSVFAALAFAALALATLALATLTSSPKTRSILNNVIVRRHAVGKRTADFRRGTKRKSRRLRLVDGEFRTRCLVAPRRKLIAGTVGAACLNRWHRLVRRQGIQIRGRTRIGTQSDRIKRIRGTTTGVAGNGAVKGRRIGTGSAHAYAGIDREASRTASLPSRHTSASASSDATRPGAAALPSRHTATGTSTQSAHRPLSLPSCHSHLRQSGIGRVE